MNTAIGEAYSFDETLTLASSIARRNVQERDWQNSVIAETLPAQTPLPVEVRQSIETGITVIALRFLEDPTTPVSATETVEAIVDNKLIVDMFKSRGEEPDEESISSVKYMVSKSIEDFCEVFQTDTTHGDELLAMIEAARIVADRHDVATWDVLDSDELYAELIRTRFTPAMYAEHVSSAVEKFNEETMKKVVSSMLEAILHEMLVTGEITEAELAKERAEIQQEFAEEMELQAELRGNFEAIRSIIPKLVQRSIERFWSETALPELGSQLGRIILKHPEAPLTKGLLRQQKENDLVATLCMERGWNPRRLTIEEHKEIYTSTEMRDFLANNQ